MNSYNDYSNIKRIKCENTEATEFVSLREYLIFENDDNQKYAVFKIQNNLEQYLYEVKFIVSQYNGNDDLIEKSTISYKNFRVDGKEYLVPDAKFKCNPSTERIALELTYGVFERMIFDNGNIIDVKYDYLDYKSEEEKKAEELEKASLKKNSKKDKDILYHDKKAAKKLKNNKKNVNIKDITNQNKTNKPATFNILFSVIIIGLCCLFAYNIGRDSATLRYNNVVYSKVTDESGITTLSVTGIDESATTVTIEGILNGYQVGTIAAGAITGDKISEVIINASLTVEPGAFNSCPNLTSIITTEDASCVFRTQSVADCAALSRLYAPKSNLNNGAITITSEKNMAELTFSRTNTSLFYAIFSGANANSDLSEGLTVCVPAANGLYTDTYFEGFNGTIKRIA